MSKSSPPSQSKKTITTGTFYRRRVSKFPQSIPILTPEFARDFAIGVVEIWYTGEKSDPRQWTTKRQPRHPYVLFWKKNRMVDVYVDRLGLDWIHDEVLHQMSIDPQFPFRAANEFVTRIRKIKKIYEKEPALPLIELKEYLAVVRDLWPWFEAVWWMIDFFDGKREYAHSLKRLQAVRREGQEMAPSTNAIIRKSIVKAYPKMAPYYAVLLLKEVFSGKLPPTTQLEARMKEYFFTDDTLFVNTTPSEIEKRFHIKIKRVNVSENVSELKGQVAFPGIVRGKVRKILGRSDLPSFKKGEIIVSPTTTPDFLPALIKAAAFVTNEGGIVSHAAITAREMKKPCIIGTKIATKVLNDGDWIEVDATNGIVRVLSTEKRTDSTELFDSSLHWSHYLARPFTLFEASIWYEWYNSTAFQEVFGMKWTNGLFVEHPRGMTRQYREKEVLNHFLERTKKMVKKSPKRVDALLTIGIKLNQKAESMLKKSTILDINEAVRFCGQLLQYAATVPYFAGDLISKKADPKIKTKISKLRATSYYPLFLKEIILPLAEKRLQKLGISDKGALRAVTYRELLTGNVQSLKERLKFIREGKHFVYQTLHGVETVSWVDDSSSVIESIEGKKGENKSLRGVGASKGIVTGKVRLVLSNDIRNVQLKKGEILVASSTNPTISPLMKKAGAIVTDEGGVASHAAIISRELGVPCVVGTKYATRELRNGDVVKVNANAGTVKIIKRVK